MATGPSLTVESTRWHWKSWLFTHPLELLITEEFESCPKKTSLYTVKSSKIIYYMVSRKKNASPFKMPPPAHKKCATPPNSLETQEPTEWSQRGRGRIHNFSSIADGRDIHVSWSWKRKIHISNQDLLVAWVYGFSWPWNEGEYKGTS